MHNRWATEDAVDRIEVLEDGDAWRVVVDVVGTSALVAEWHQGQSPQGDGP